MPRSILTSIGAAALLIALLAGLSAATSRPAPARSPVYAAWIPPGEYTAIVLCSNADTRRWNVRFVRGGGGGGGGGGGANPEYISIVVPPREMVVLPFQGGWQVRASDKARFESDLVPFEEFAEGNPVTGEGNMALSAWGIGPNGPVAFTYTQIK